MWDYIIPQQELPLCRAWGIYAVYTNCLVWNYFNQGIWAICDPEF